MNDFKVSGLTDEEQHTATALWKQYTARQHANYTRASYYDGKRALAQIGTVIPPQYYNLGIVLGWSAKAVDLLARRCKLQRFTWANGDLNDIGFSELWEGNHLASEISQAMTSSLIYGTSFLITTSGDVSSEEPRALIHAKDARSATGIWSNRTRSLVAGLSVTGTTDEGHPIEIVLYLPNLTITVSRPSENARWSVSNRHAHVYGVPMDPLVYKPLPGRPFGYSRISRPVMSLHDQALRTVIRMEGHADVYSYPEMWMLGADESIFSDAAGNPKPVWQVMMGRIKGIPDDPDQPDPNLARADVKQFSASSPRPHIESLEQQAMLFSGETSIPVTSLGVSSDGNPTSAESYIASREDLIAEAEGATDEWSPSLKRSMLRAFRIANGETHLPPEWRTIQPEFRSPIYTSRAQAADAGSKVLAAAPELQGTEVGLELLGLTPDQITRAMSEMRRGRSAQMLSQLSRLGAAAESEPFEDEE